MNLSADLTKALSVKNPFLFFISGANDMYFGRNYSGVFLPYDGNPKSHFGVYYIAGINKFFCRRMAARREEFRLVGTVDEHALRTLLMSFIEQVIINKQSAAFAFNMQEGIEKLDNTTVKQDRPRKSLAREGNYLILKGWNRSDETISLPGYSQRPATPLQPGEVTFTYRSTQR